MSRHPAHAATGARCPSWVVLAWLVATFGCDSGSSLAGDRDADDGADRADDGFDVLRDVDADADARSDAHADADAGADSDVDADADVALDVPAGSCGDGVRNVGEGCDDGNAIDDDGCRNDCSLPTCGDGIVSDIEECDDGPANSDTVPDACRTRCVRPVCGDGVVDTGERCDDGNRLDGDACPAACFPDDELPAEPVGEPEPADDTFDAGGPPVVGWSGSSWGVAWGAWGPLQYRALDADAHPIGPLVTLPVDGGYAAIAWGNDRFAFAAANWSYYEVAVGTIDALGVLRSGPTWMPGNGEHPGIAWSERLTGWILAFNRLDSSGGDPGPAIVTALFDDSARLVDGPLDVGWGEGPVPVAMRSRVAVAWSGEGGIRYRGFPWPDTAAASELLALPMFIHSDGAVDAVGYHDFALVIAMDGAHAQVGVVDALAGTVAHGPIIVGSSGIEDRRPHLAAVTERGFLGLCYETGIGPPGGSGHDGIAFRVIRPDGMPVGAEVVVAAELMNAGGCDVGWSGTEFVVLYWSCGGGAAENVIYAQRVRPLL